MRRLFCIFLTFAILSTLPDASADSYAPPTPQTISSPTGNFLLRTLPPIREGKTSKWSNMTVIIYQLNTENQDYREISRFETQHHPGTLMINDSGTRIVTFDHYFGTGHGDRIIAVLDRSGKDLKTWKLTDIYADSVIDGLERSTSNIFWRSDVWMSRAGDSVTVAPPGDGPFKSAQKLSYLKLDLEKLVVTKID